MFEGDRSLTCASAVLPGRIVFFIVYPGLKPWAIVFGASGAAATTWRQMLARRTAKEAGRPTACENSILLDQPRAKREARNAKR